MKDDYWKYVENLNKKVTQNTQKILENTQEMVKAKKENARQYLNESKEKGRRYVGDKAREGRQYVGRKSAEAARHAYQYASQHHRRFWEFVAFKQRAFHLLRISFMWFRSTRLFRWSRTGLILGVIGKGGYVYGTHFEREITITKSFNQLRETSSGVQNTYFVADENKRLYQVVPSLWFWQWWPDELWAFMKEGQTYKVHGYGYRIQKMRIHPRIVGAQRKIPEVPGVSKLEDYERYESSESFENHKDLENKLLWAYSKISKIFKI